MDPGVARFPEQVTVHVCVCYPILSATQSVQGVAVSFVALESVNERL